MNVHTSKVHITLRYAIDQKLLEESQLTEIGVSVQQGTLVFTEEASIALFQPLVENIRNHLNKILKQVKSIDYVILTGSLGNSSILQDCIKECIPMNATVVVPFEPGLAVIKGAVYYGHKLR